MAIDAEGRFLHRELVCSWVDLDNGCIGCSLNSDRLAAACLANDVSVYYKFNIPMP
jgi:G3E family GTPase